MALRTPCVCDSGSVIVVCGVAWRCVCVCVSYGCGLWRDVAWRGLGCGCGLRVYDMRQGCTVYGYGALFHMVMVLCCHGMVFKSCVACGVVCGVPVVYWVYVMRGKGTMWVGMVHCCVGMV